MVRLSAVVALAVLLSGCNSTPVEQLSYSELKALTDELVKRCEAQGVKNATPEMQICLRQEASREASIRREKHDKDRSSVMCQRFGMTTVCG